MKKLIATIAIALLSTSVFAQETPPENPGITALPLMMPCNTSDVIFNMLQSEEYNEAPVALGNGTVFTPSGEPVPGQLTLWYNSIGKKNFTIVFTLLGGSGLSCIVSSGVNMELLPVAFGTPI